MTGGGGLEVGATTGSGTASDMLSQSEAESSIFVRRAPNSRKKQTYVKYKNTKTDILFFSFFLSKLVLSFLFACYFVG